MAPVFCALADLPVKFEPMRLTRRLEPFDHPDWLFELKLDGFRALAHFENGKCVLVSRNGNTFAAFRNLAAEIAGHFKGENGILDGEIDAGGRARRVVRGARPLRSKQWRSSNRRCVLHISTITQSPVTRLSAQWVSLTLPESKKSCKKTLQAWRFRRGSRAFY
jgi:hypothetical protein